MLLSADRNFSRPGKNLKAARTSPGHWTGVAKIGAHGCSEGFQSRTESFLHTLSDEIILPVRLGCFVSTVFKIYTL